MEDNNYDYLKTLSEEDQLAILEIRRKRLEEQENKYNQIMDDIDNRKKRYGMAALACGLAATIAVCIFIIAKEVIDTGKGDPIETTASLVIPTYEVERYYTVEFNDNLTYLSRISGMSIDEIKEKNHLSGDLIKYNQRLVLVYKILPTDLMYCTESVSVDNRSIQEIAGLYNTSIRSLYELNKESIEEEVVDNRVNYSILSDTILVPNYKTPSEVNEARNNKELTK